ncbi:actin-related protein 2/3 complex subunit 5-C [Sitodiplosis mosellana]|uniref:actin-related protein 2/3 complex subunit 5-C n=1 Tax=Sitodiplosis mosellana TaxID=263140 RepID=UPI0024451E4C|nr:actin-related protein 2/3 complex subunit 5-C [Sitodiplosis mosellana]
MAKNTSSSAFRKINVDQYNEDNFKEDEIDSNGTVYTGPDDAEITKLLNTGKNVEALKLVLENAPLTSKNQQAKENARQLTLKVLLSIKGNQMDSAITALNDVDLVDVLMKYIYRGFEFPSDNSSAHLLQWHEKVYARYGVGCIMRVLTCTNRA